jgi:DNA-binding XRE family transcriptional regulator
MTVTATRTRTNKAPGLKPARRAGARAVSLEESGIFKDRPRLRQAYEGALFAQEAARLVRLMRESAGLNQRELAERLGVTQPRVARLEKVTGGDGPSYAMIRRVAIACGVNWAPPMKLTTRNSETPR